VSTLNTTYFSSIPCPDHLYSSTLFPNSHLEDLIRMHGTGQLPRAL